MSKESGEGPSNTALSGIAKATRQACRELLGADERGKTSMAPEATKTILATIATWGIPIIEMTNMQAEQTWIWSDLHLRDGASVRFHRRPFWMVRTHDRALMRRGRQTVGAGDTIIHAGDFASEFVHDAARTKLLDSLPGRKINVLGNHDVAGLLAPLTDGWDETHGALVVAADPPLVVTHCPLRTVSAGAVNVHGHTHRRWDRRNDPRINVAVEQTGCRPVRLSRVIDEARRRLAGEAPQPLGTAQTLWRAATRPTR